MFRVYSVFDVLSNHSVYLTLHYTDSDAVRCFRNGLTRVPEFASSLELHYIGSFDPETLRLEGFETPVLIAEGSDYIEEVSE